MRYASCLIACVLLTSAAPSPAAALQRPAPPACAGVIDIVRVSTVKPGKMDTFLKAVEAQTAWYKQQGTTDEISVIRLVDTKTGGYSDTEVMTSHTEPDGQEGKRAPNAGYEAFVALFRASSDIQQQFIGCKQK